MDVDTPEEILPEGIEPRGRAAGEEVAARSGLAYTMGIISDCMKPSPSHAG